ncbi:MAG: hypothetical protein AAF847_09780 [Bacteroidota bacterium]
MKAFENYINSLSIQELRDLILKFAPQSYVEEVLQNDNAKKGNTKAIISAFNKARTYFDELFTDEEDLYDIDKFALKAERAFDKIKPFSSYLPEQITDMICDFLEEVDESFENNYLYNHSYNYYGEEAYEGVEVGIFIGEFIAAIPNEHRKQSLSRILDVKNKMGHGLAENTAHEIIENLPAQDWEVFTPIVAQTNFMKYLDSKEKLRIYKKMSPYLAEKNKEQTLQAQSNAPHTNLELAQLYITQARYKEAFDTLAKFIKQETKNNHYAYYQSLELLHQQFQLLIKLSEEHFEGKFTGEWLYKYLAVTPSVESFQFAVATRPAERLAFENTLEKDHLFAYFAVLEAENRLQAVVDGFEKHSSRLTNLQTQYQFFQRHKSQFPAAAKSIFSTLLEKVLPKTGDHAYQQVVEYLGQLKAVLPTPEFEQLVKVIRAKYYRRRNLLSLLNGQGF